LTTKFKISLKVTKIVVEIESLQIVRFSIVQIRQFRILPGAPREQPFEGKKTKTFYQLINLKYQWDNLILLFFDWFLQYRTLVF
jgi:hypothetical protein